MKVSRAEILVLITMVGCMASIILPTWQQKKRASQAAVASYNVQVLYQNQVLQYFSSRNFTYSLTRPVSWPDFFTARPPLGEPEKLVGFIADPKDPEHQENRLKYVNWSAIGFPLTQPSYYVYRVEPEPAYETISMIPDLETNPMNFHAMAIGDTDGDGRYSVLLRGGYADSKGQFHGMENLIISDYLE